MALAAGTRLGPYEITGLIGEGGMGQVYRATDTNLKRTVAIKVLPQAVADDPERLARFQREAEVLARLNHPNVAQIHGLERSAGTIALAMELVDGPTLADRIARGAIPIDEALVLAKQIAEALEAAHEQNIIHRDLKPSNVKVRPDGMLKVLDFGLAKAFEQTEAPRGDLTHSPTITSPALMTGVMTGDDRQARPYLQNEFNQTQGKFSPNGKFVAYTSDETGRLEVYVQPFPVATGKWKISQGGGAQPHRRPDGKELFFISGDSKLMAAATFTTVAFDFRPAQIVFPAPIVGGGATFLNHRFGVTRDGQRFLVNSLLSDGTAPASITVVLNWQEDLKRRTTSR